MASPKRKPWSSTLPAQPSPASPRPRLTAYPRFSVAKPVHPDSQLQRSPATAYTPTATALHLGVAIGYSCTMLFQLHTLGNLTLFPSLHTLFSPSTVRTLGWRSPSSLPVPPSVTFCSSVTQEAPFYE